MLSIPRLIIIAGNGRDSGKTSFACRLIQKFSHRIPLVAVKISPHKHMPVSPDVNSQSDPFTITEEMDADSNKDSSRMLAAGAERSFFVTCNDENLNEVAIQLMGLAGKESFVICESGGLRKYAEPGIFLLVNRKERMDIKPESLKLNDFKPLWIIFDGKEFDFDINRIMIRDSRWIVISN